MVVSGLNAVEQTIKIAVGRIGERAGRRQNETRPEQERTPARNQGLGHKGMTLLHARACTLYSGALASEY